MKHKACAMPHKPRMYLVDVPAYLVQRGNYRDACCFCDDDYPYYLEVLGQGLRRDNVKLHAYCLMTNHVHLLEKRVAFPCCPTYASMTHVSEQNEFADSH